MTHAIHTTHRLHGLAVRSPWRLSAPEVDEPPEFTISFGGECDTTAPIDAPLLALGRKAEGQTFAHADWPQEGVVTIRFAGFAEFEIDEGAGSIRARIQPGIDERFLPLLLEGAVPAFVLGLRSAPLLHAAAVSLDGKSAIAITGTVGQGKTTTAAMLCGAGAKLVSDDTLRLDLGNDALVHPGTTTLRLRPAAKEVADWFPGDQAVTVDERIRVEPEHSGIDRLPLDAVVVPAPDRDQGGIAVEEISAGEAARILLSAARFASWTDVTRLREHLDLATKLAAAVPAYWARIPLGPPFDRSAAGDLFDRLANLEPVTQPR